MLMAAAVLVGVAPAAAVAKGCPHTVAVKGDHWQYQGTGVSCKFMKKWTRSWIRDAKAPKGCTCTSGGQNGLCDKKRGKATFVFQQSRKR